MTDDKHDREHLDSEKPPPTGHLVTACHDRYIHSHVWEKLVTGPDDLEGLVAYGLYQKRKREWITAWEQEHGVPPSWEEVKIFISGQQSTAIIELKENASNRSHPQAFQAAGFAGIMGSVRLARAAAMRLQA